MCPSNIQHLEPLHPPSLRHFRLIPHVLSFEVCEGSALRASSGTGTGPHSREEAAFCSLTSYFGRKSGFLFAVLKADRQGAGGQTEDR